MIVNKSPGAAAPVEAVQDYIRKGNSPKLARLMALADAQLTTLAKAVATAQQEQADTAKAIESFRVQQAETRRRVEAIERANLPPTSAPSRPPVLLRTISREQDTGGSDLRNPSKTVH
jgi:hypothetical protein